MKKKLYFPIIFVGLFALHSVVFASDNSNLNAANQFLKVIFTDNADYVNSTPKTNFSVIENTQTPQATVLTCSDSRFQSTVFHKNPVNQLFFVRNIGNQIVTTEGSVEYGIYHLKTPVLLIIGHSNCGAIHAAMGDYSNELEPIRKELDHLKLSKQKDLNQNIVENVHQQVEFAIQKFKDKINDKSLVVVGTVYDFNDNYHHDHGRLILVNLNGEKDPAKIKQDPLLKDVPVNAVGAD